MRHRRHLAWHGDLTGAAIDESVTDAKAVATGAADSHLRESRHLLAAGAVVSDTTRRMMLRDTIDHWVHHRGQMPVYLRLMGADVPATCGPSADDNRYS